MYRKTGSGSSFFVDVHRHGSGVYNSHHNLSMPHRFSWVVPIWRCSEYQDHHRVVGSHSNEVVWSRYPLAGGESLHSDYSSQFGLF